MKMDNMRIILGFGFYLVLSLQGVYGDSENEIKRGVHTFMAIVYYPDPSIVDTSGTRVSRSAVLIRPNWLISSSLETNDTHLAFPKKTLLARVGAIAIDSNFTLNEDEGEQEQEIIKIVRPTNFNVSQWWKNDITLLETVRSFTKSALVASTTLAVKRDYIDKICYVLVFAKMYKNSTDDKLLMQLAVTLLQSSNDNCGVHFQKDTMICASNSDENKNIIYAPNFCYNNGGGPLMCEGDVIGLQTYISNNCKQPYLYQLLSAWDDFISCGVEKKCHLSECANICMNIDKDDEDTSFGTNKILNTPTSLTTKEILLDRSVDLVVTEEKKKEEIMEGSTEEENKTLQDTTLPKVKIANESEIPTPTTLSTTEITVSKETPTSTTTETEEKATGITEGHYTSWPKEKIIEYRKKLDEAEGSENIERTTNVEAQRQEAKKKSHGAAENNVNGKVSLTHSLYFVLLLFKCIV